jgi:hypothetical protein
MEFIIHEYWKGFGVWYAEPNWIKKEPLEIFATRQQAEEYEQQLFSGEHHKTKG